MNFMRNLLGFLTCAVFLSTPLGPLRAADFRVVETQQERRSQYIRERFADYEPKLEGDHNEQIEKWGRSFLDKRTPELAAAGTKITEAANRIRLKRGIDATQLKDDQEFRKLLTGEITEILNPQYLRNELRSWAQGVEAQTRMRMIKCFQQVIAEDLGRSFDENLKNVVVNAVANIPVEKLVADADSVAKIEKEILKALPESTVSQSSRKAIKFAAVGLARYAAITVVETNVATKLNPVWKQVIVESATDITGWVADAGVEKINEELTKNPTPEAVQEAFKAALSDWNSSHLKPRLEEILSDYRRDIIQHLETKAGAINTLLP